MDVNVTHVVAAAAALMLVVVLYRAYARRRASRAARADAPEPCACADAPDEAQHLLSCLERTEPVVVMFYADWCPACQAFKPEFARAVEMMRSEGQQALMVDYAKHRAPIDRAHPALQRDITHFPTIMLLQPDGGGGVAHMKYEGDRTADAVVQFSRDVQI
jgi:thiol-disulfide isomerase/thioredoxin